MISAWARTQGARVLGSGASPRAVRVTFLLLVTAVIALADLQLTLTYATNGGFAEANPLARAVMQLGSPALLVVFKLATLVLGLGILFRLRDRLISELGTWVCLGAMVVLTIHWWQYVHAAPILTSAVIDGSLDQDEGWVEMSP